MAELLRGQTEAQQTLFSAKYPAAALPQFPLRVIRHAGAVCWDVFLAPAMEHLAQLQASLWEKIRLVAFRGDAHDVIQDRQDSLARGTMLEL